MIGVGAVVREIVGVSNVECACNLGSVALYVIASDAVVGNFDGVSNLGDGVGGLEIFSTLSIAS